MPKHITHKTLNTWLDRIEQEPEFQIGSKAKYNPGAWYRQKVTLEFPVGELCKDWLSKIALIGVQSPCITSLTGKEGFDAQGLEGKVTVEKDLFSALMNMRDILPANRGRILL